MMDFNRPASPDTCVVEIPRHPLVALLDANDRRLVAVIDEPGKTQSQKSSQPQHIADRKAAHRICLAAWSLVQPVICDGGNRRAD